MIDPQIHQQSKQVLDRALADYQKVTDDYVAALEAKGLKFAPPYAEEDTIQQLRSELAERGVKIRNGGASLSWGFLSPACEACTDSVGSETFSTTFKCHRDCYFCFNHNVADYQGFVDDGCPWEEGLRTAHATKPDMKCLGLTGGEPLLSLDNSLKFLKEARALYPDAHLRMYTSGDLLTPTIAQQLADAGLNEIRFSVKDFDPKPLQERVLANMAMAKEYFEIVMVEMPIIPYTDARMKELFRSFEEIGIDGINMLEFCFPFHNWEAYEERGFLIRNPPYPIMFDYQYSGGLPIFGSELLILELMKWALDHSLTFGMHYCSLENKHRSEMRQRNERADGTHPCLTFDPEDFFLKGIRVFGPERALAKELLASKGCTAFVDDDDEDSTTVPYRYGDLLRKEGFWVAEAFHALDSDDRGSFIMDVGLKAS